MTGAQSSSYCVCTAFTREWCRPRVCYSMRTVQFVQTGAWQQSALVILWLLTIAPTVLGEINGLKKIRLVYIQEAIHYWVTSSDVGNRDKQSAIQCRFNRGRNLISLGDVANNVTTTVRRTWKGHTFPHLVMILTEALDLSPSMSVSIWDTIRLSTSPFVLSRLGAMESISSMKMMAGAFFSACSEHTHTHTAETKYMKGYYRKIGWTVTLSRFLFSGPNPIQPSTL